MISRGTHLLSSVFILAGCSISAPDEFGIGLGRQFYNANSVIYNEIGSLQVDPAEATTVYFDFRWTFGARSDAARRARMAEELDKSTNERFEVNRRILDERTKQIERLIQTQHNVSHEPVIITAGSSGADGQDGGIPTWLLWTLISGGVGGAGLAGRMSGKTQGPTES